MQFVSAMDEKLAACYKETNLKRLRQYAGLSQSELAELSKVPLRQIQLFEQRQRNINHTTAVTVLMLARALYKNGPVVVLDEPTAALDPIAESDLYQKYSDLTGDRTSVYISHRLASTRFCDRVLLIENGGIAEEGTHEELLNAGGRYAYLFDIQSKYYTKGAMEDE